MPEDFVQTFRDIFPDPRQLQEQIFEIQPHIQLRTRDQIPTLKCLAINANRLSEKDTFEHADGDLDGSDDAKPRDFDFADAETPELHLVLLDMDEPLDQSFGLKYLAVSYRWPSPDAHAKHVQTLNSPVIIHEPDGSVRPSRAPAHVLRRAVRHAASLRIPHIWIDQESIDQTDSDEKESAIQHMDSVYNHATHVLALLDVTLDDESEVALLEYLHQLNRHAVGSKFDSMARGLTTLRGPPEMALALASILTKFADSPWFQRAWIYHERLCAGNLGSTELWAECDDNLYGSVRGEVCLIGMDQIRDSRELAFNLEQGTYTSTEICSPTQIKEAAARLRTALVAFESSYALAQPAALRRRLCDDRRSQYGLLQVIDHLQRLKCLFPSDKLAILANVRSWHWRIDSRLADERQWSFSLVIWLLALANGDASLFCPDSNCHTNATSSIAAWAPPPDLSLGSIYCSGLLDHVSMKLSPGGLITEGWLFDSLRFLDLGDLAKDISRIDEEVPDVERIDFVNGEWVEEVVEDTAGKLQRFFWILLSKLQSIGEYDCMDLVWEAVKIRYRGGFYGRSLKSLLISSFNNIIDRQSGEFIGCCDSLAVPKEKLSDSDFMAWGPLADEAIKYLRMRCKHCRTNRQEKDIPVDDDKTPSDLQDQQRKGSTTVPNPSRADNSSVSETDSLASPPSIHLLGGKEQLTGLTWIRTAILANGGLTVGHIRSGEVHAKIEKHHDGTDEPDSSLRSTPVLALINLPPSNSSTAYPPRDQNESSPTSSSSSSAAASVYVLHREVRKYKSGDGKAMNLLHPFDVWLADAPSHTDKPIVWDVVTLEEGKQEKAGVDALPSLQVMSGKERREVLFDIGRIPRSQNMLSWPEVYGRDSWDVE